MGQANRTSTNSQSGHYFSQQLKLYRWRADSAYNMHLPRVKFFSKKTMLHRTQFQNLLYDQLRFSGYVDVSQVTRLPDETEQKEQQQIMTFQTFVDTLDAFGQCLSFEENLYVLQVLLSGYQMIYLKLRDVFVSPDCCFVNEKGQVRCWINQNYTLNQFSQNCKEGSQPNAIYQILKICSSLSSNQALFSYFNRQLQQYLNADILRNLNFSAVRRFINGYIFTHQLVLPFDISQSLKRLDKDKSERPLRSSSALSVLLQPPQYSNSCNSTQVNLIQKKRSRIHYSAAQSLPLLSQKSSQGEISHDNQVEFYKPTQKLERKISNLDFNTYQKNIASQTKSHVFLKQSLQKSNSNILSNKSNIPAYHKTFTPKNAQRKKVRLYSTAQQSFLRHSKDPDDLRVSKIVQSKVNLHLHSYSQNEPWLSKQKINLKNVGFNLNSCKNSRNLSKLQTQAHSKQPSFDQSSSSFFISPTNEQAQKHCFMRQIRQKIDAVSQSQQAEEDQSFAEQGMSTLGQAFQSQMNLTRQLSELVQNNDLHLHESKGSFASILNDSRSSEYRGELLKMGRSAQVVAFPSNKRLEDNIKSNVELHLRR